MLLERLLRCFQCSRWIERFSQQLFIKISYMLIEKIIQSNWNIFCDDSLIYVELIFFFFLCCFVGNRRNEANIYYFECKICKWWIQSLNKSCEGNYWLFFNENLNHLPAFKYTVTPFLLFKELSYKTLLQEAEQSWVPEIYLRYSNEKEYIFIRICKMIQT